MVAIDTESVHKLFSRFIRNCPDTQEYNLRLAEEVELIFQLRFAEYFHQICDILELSRDIPHMTRGSAGSSLICYLLGITDVDPIY